MSGAMLVDDAMVERAWKAWANAPLSDGGIAVMRAALQAALTPEAANAGSPCTSEEIAYYASCDASGWEPRAKPEAAQAEAVAWVAKGTASSEGTIPCTYGHDPASADAYRRKGWEVTPLYTTPPATVPVAALRELKRYDMRAAWAHPGVHPVCEWIEHPEGHWIDADELTALIERAGK